MRTNHKPISIQQLVKKANPSIKQYAANERDNFEKYMLKKSVLQASGSQRRQQF